MSRLNVAKSRVEKTGTKTSLSTSTPVTHDIVPGKFTDLDWWVPSLLIVNSATLFSFRYFRRFCEGQIHYGGKYHH